MNGYTGQLLRVNLSSGKIAQESISRDILRRTIGGRGLAAEILLSELPPEIDPLGPDNKLVVATGPFQEALIPGAAHYALCAKSPLTGGWGEAHAAGSFGPMLKRAGYDAAIIEGQASSPAYLWFTDQDVELRDAREVWGKSTGETLEAIRTQTTEKAEVAAIGCAGEKLVRYSGVVNDYDRIAARSGLGAVMGSKRLKAIAVYGETRTHHADEACLRELTKEAVAQVMAHPGTKRWRDYGTPGGVEGANDLGMFPVQNFREGNSDDELIGMLTGETMAETILVKNSGCVACPLRCHRHVGVQNGPFSPVDPKYGGPEFETIGAFGSNLGIYNLEFVSRASQLCNMYGIDTLSIGMIMSWAFECYERGFIRKQDASGLELTWGNASAALELIEAIAHRRGIGDILAEGMKASIATFGSETAGFAMHVKNQPFAVHIPRGRKGQALSYATSNRGACHLQGMHDTTIEAGRIAPELGIDEKFKGISRFSTELKPDFEMHAQHWRAVEDSLIICKFAAWDYGAITPELIFRLLNAATGESFTSADIRWIGERTFNACRLFNVREGFTRQDDVLPAREAEPMSRGRSKGSVVTAADLQGMLDRYYTLRGWDARGVPTPEKLKALNLPLS